MKTNIKMKCDDSQFRKVMNILKIDYKSYLYYEDMYIIINNDLNVDFGYGGTIYNDSNCKEIDTDLFIRTNGTCQETFKDKADLYFKQADDYYKKVEDSITNLIIVELQNKLKKKNEILKKARIKRKNQREELQKLNLKLQKCIDLEAHNIATQKLRDTIIRLKCENIKQRDSIREEQNKEIEKLKSVIEYLESKVK